MGEALYLVIGGLKHEHALIFAGGSVLLQVFVPYSIYARYCEMADPGAVLLRRRNFHRRNSLAQSGFFDFVANLSNFLLIT